ncbi:MAG TPA: hypothetical protein VF042_01890 [Gemmatimonadaceae bacterium]
MRSVALATLTALLTVVACQDPISSSPASLDLSVRDAGTFVGSNPPPPPIDSGAVGTASTETETSTIQFNVTYFFNRPETSGWLKFNRDAYDNTDIDNSAAIKLTNGVLSGKGIIRVFVDDGVYRIDLSKVTFGERTGFSECDATGSCFLFDLSGAGVTYIDKAGTPHEARIIIGPDKVRTDSCLSTTSDACIITDGQ